MVESSAGERKVTGFFSNFIFWVTGVVVLLFCIMVVESTLPPLRTPNNLLSWSNVPSPTSTSSIAGPECLPSPSKDFTWNTYLPARTFGNSTEVVVLTCSFGNPGISVVTTYPTIFCAFSGGSHSNIIFTPPDLFIVFDARRALGASISALSVSVGNIGSSTAVVKSFSIASNFTSKYSTAVISYWFSFWFIAKIL